MGVVRDWVMDIRGLEGIIQWLASRLQSISTLSICEMIELVWNLRA